MELLAKQTPYARIQRPGAHNLKHGLPRWRITPDKTSHHHPDIKPIETAIYRLTKEPADYLGIDAGDISVGKRADLIIIDPTKLDTDLNTEPIEDYHPQFSGSYRLIKTQWKK